MLQVISSSPGDLEPVFQAMLAKATRICEAKFGILFRHEDGLFHPTALLDVPPAFADFLRRQRSFAGKPGQLFGRLCQAKKVIHVIDRATEPHTSPSVRHAGARSSIAVPMLKENELIGAFFIYRTEVRPFTDKQIELVKNFAAQAVIAIENTRLLNELRQRTDDLSESLEQQTATSEVLRVISSSPTNVQPVFDAIAESAVRLCGGQFCFVVRFDGKVMDFASSSGLSAEGLQAFRRLLPQPASEDTASGHAILRRAVVEIADVEPDPAYGVKGLAKTVTYRSIVGVPSLHEGNPIGAIAVARANIGSFPKRQIVLLQAFADQAVIAIENVRLFDEVQARTRDLSESLQQQTATADVLKVISRSTFDLQTVLDTLIESATRLCDADHAWLFQREGEFFHWVAGYGHATEVHAQIRDYFRPLQVPVDRGSVTGRVALEARVVHVPDVLADPDYTWGEAQRIGGYRAALGVPLLRKGNVVGVIFVAKIVPQPYSDKQIELVTTFADQAVIAIENTRLLNELRESLQQQTATADVLKVISRSTFDLQPVLDTLTESAARLCDAEMAAIAREKDAAFYYATSYGFPADYLEFVKGIAHPVNRGSVIGRTMTEGKAVQISDVLSDPEYAYLESQKKGGFRTMLGVPLLREGNPIGVLLLARSSVRPFTPKQIELVSTFADQAVIAIENVRLFDEVQARTRDLSESLQQQTATADVLKVISRSTFDLQVVLDTLVGSAAKLCEAENAFIYLRDGDVYRVTANHGFSREFEEFIKQHPVLPGRGTLTGRTALEGKMVHIPDVLVDPEYTLTEAIKLGKFRTMLGIPLLREGTPIGVMALTRSTVQPFSDKQIDLISTFADQGVIAIENVRLFDEVQARTRELSEALEQQTATSDVLSVISSSPGELTPVFESMLENAVRICEASFGNLLLYENDAFRHVALHNAPQAWAAEQKRDPVAPRRSAHFLYGVADTKQVTHIVDIALENPDEPIAKVAGARSLLIVPMLKENDLIGVIAIYSSGSSAIHRQTGRAGQELRRPGRHRHREHATAQRAAPAHRRSLRGAGAADRDVGGLEGHLELAGRAGAGLQCNVGERNPHL